MDAWAVDGNGWFGLDDLTGKLAPFLFSILRKFNICDSVIKVV